MRRRIEVIGVVSGDRGFRSVSAVLLGILAPLRLVAAASSCWLHFDVVAPDALGRDIRRSLSEPAVRDELARRIARAAAGADPRAAAAEPLIRSAASIVIQSRQFADAVDIAVQVARRSVLGTGAGGRAGLADVETQVRTTVGQSTLRWSSAFPPAATVRSWICDRKARWYACSGMPRRWPGCGRSCSW